MKYVTTLINGNLPVPVLFSGALSHHDVAAMLKTPVTSAGFVTVDGGSARCVGHSTSLNLGPGPMDEKLINQLFHHTAQAYPAPVTTS